MGLKSFYFQIIISLNVVLIIDILLQIPITSIETDYFLIVILISIIEYLKYLNKDEKS